MASQHKKVKSWYKEILKSTNKNIDKLNMRNSSGKLTTRGKTNLKILRKSIDKSCSNLSDKLENLIYDNMQVLCEEILSEVEGDLEIDLDEELIKDTIDSVSMGLIYDVDWSLSDAIDVLIRDNQDLVDEVIQNGIDAGKSEEEIIEDILNIIDPTEDQQNRSYKTKDKTLYVGRFDARAQRLVRTTLEHSFQRMIQLTAQATAERLVGSKVMIRWISALASNTCPVCVSRHNNLYAPKDLPLEHPNGQCKFRIEIF